ncbi:hypothetical protein F2P79_021924 [Pimephales promelas]|nr:hypothetical protein F2P79_021924 [Pimephales promelas]
MPLDVRGCTRATMGGSACAYPVPRGAGNPLNPARDRDWGLKLFPINEEFPVSAGHKLALIKSLPFVHTARRYYRLGGLVRSLDRPRRSSSLGEPAEGSLQVSGPHQVPGTKQTRRLGSAPAGPEPPSVKNEWRESQPRRVPVRSPPQWGGRGFKDLLPIPRPGGRGRPSGSRHHSFFFPNSPVCVGRPRKTKKPRVQLLAVDHSARESMKNAASCEN